MKTIDYLIAQRGKKLTWEDCPYWRNYFIDKIKNNESILLEETAPVLKEEKKPKRKATKTSPKKEEPLVIPTKAAVQPTKFLPVIIEKTQASLPVLPLRVETTEASQTKLENGSLVEKKIS